MEEALREKPKQKGVEISEMDEEEIHNNNSIQKPPLPNDLILDHILPCLPIKLLTQCKLLSKHFNSSLSSPKFILKHTKQPLISCPKSPVETLFIQSGKIFYLYSPVFDDNVPEFGNVNYSSKDYKKGLVKLDDNLEFGKDDKIELVGCSNGLVCLADFRGRYFILYNPATKQSHKYYSGDCELLETNISPVYWGFGHVSYLNNFKVVRIMLYWNGKASTVHVFSLVSNSWKFVEFDIERGMLMGGTKLANETVYWNKVEPQSTLAFDLASETFKWYYPLVAKPMNWDPQVKHMVGGCLCVMGGCISRCRSNSKDEVIIDTISAAGRMEHVRLGCGLRVDPEDEFIGFTKTGKVFVAYTKQAMLGLLDRNSKRILVKFRSSHRIHIQPYVPSQVSPLPSTKGPSSSNQGTWATGVVDLSQPDIIKLN